MQKLLITGAGGFVGSRLIQRFQGTPGLEIYALTRNPDALSSIERGILKGAFTYDDASFWQGHSFHTLVHCAGKAHDVRNAADAGEYDRVNYELTKDIFRRFEAAGGSTFIYLSSVKAVADAVDGILDESSVPSPKTPYGMSKLKAEEFLQNKMQTTGIKIYILRPCVIYGPGVKGNLRLLYNFAKWGLPWPLGAFSNERSFLYIDNLAFVIKEIVEGNVAAGVYHVADEECLSTNELIARISEAVGGKARIWNIPQFVIKGLAKAGDFLHLPLNTERLEKLTGNYRVSVGKITKEIGKNMPYNTRQGLRLTFTEKSGSG